MPSNKRCIFGCITTGVTIHSFPNPKKNTEIFNSWVTLAADYLKDMSTEVIHKKIKVCDKHFTNELKNRNSRLNALAIPTLHLPFSVISKPNLVLDLETNSPSPSCSEILVSDSLNEQPNTNNYISNVPSASLQVSDVDVAIRNDHDFCQKSHNSKSLTNSDVDVTIRNDHAFCQKSHNSKSLTNSDVDAAVRNDHDFRQQSQNSKSLIESESRKSRGILSIEHYKRMKTEIKNLKREVLRLRKGKADLKYELQIAKKHYNSKCLEKVIQKMTLPAKIFTKMQFRESHKKVKGHRFTTQEKFLSLSLYQKSPKCYATLSQYFRMPSVTTLKKLQANLK